MNSLLFTFQIAYIADIVLVLSYLIFAIIMAKKGAIRCIIGLFATIIALICAIIFAKDLANWSEKSFSFISFLGDKLEKAFLKIKGFDMDVSSAGIEESLKDVTLPEFIKKFIVEKFGNSEVESGTTLASLTAASSSEIIVRLIAGIVLFFGIKILLLILGKVLTFIANKHSFIEATNVLLGVFIGIFEAFVVTCGILALISLIPSQNITEFFNKTYFVKYLYNDNPLIKLLLH